MDRSIEKIKTLPDEVQQIQWLEYLRKDKWLWANLEKPPFRKMINFARSKNEALKNKYKEVQSTWIT